jgi:amidase
MPIEIFIDHTGPMSANVADNALMLEVLAGDDGYDPRIKAPAVAAYSEQLDGGVKGLKIALVKEGFGLPNSQADVDAKVRSGAKLLEKLGAEVTEVSIPMHLAGGAIWTPIGTEGLTQTMMWGDGYGVSRSDLYSTALMDFHRGWRWRADEMSESTKLLTLLGTYINEQFGSRFYGKAVNVSRRLKAAYDAVLADHDLLLLPTLPIKASKIPEPGAPREEIIARAFEMIANTAPFNLTHHPAMSIPCGVSEGLPVGLMLVGKAFDEPTVYRAARAFEQAADWKKL